MFAKIVPWSSLGALALVVQRPDCQQFGKRWDQMESGEFRNFSILIGKSPTRETGRHSA
jgi:hypothetical protein